MTTYYNARAGEIIPGAQTLWVPIPIDSDLYIGRGADGLYAYANDGHLNIGEIECPYLPGFVLAVREDWRLDDADERLALKEYEGGMNPDWIFYPDPVHLAACFIDWRRADTMPDWAIRHRFPIASVTAKRLSEATTEDGILAGCPDVIYNDVPAGWLTNHLTTLHGPAEWYWVLTKETP